MPKLPRGRRQLLGIAIGLLVISLIVFTLFLVSKRSHSPIPARISKQLEAPALLPSATLGNFVLDKSSFKYAATDQVLSYIVSTPSPVVNISITEQPTPSEFIDIPDAYTKLVNSFNTFLTFDTPVGTVNVGHPTQLKGNQAAVLNGEGDLLFAHPDHDLTEMQWRQLFNSLSIVR